MPRDPKPRWIKSGRWRFRFQGHDHYAVLGGPSDWAGAARWADQIRQAADQLGRAAMDPEVWQVCDWYLYWSAQRGSAAKTREQYRAILSHWCRLAGPHRKARDIQPIDLARAERWFESRGQASSRWHLVKVVLACWAWAARPEPDRTASDGSRLPDRLLDRNPLEGYRRPKAPKSRRQASERGHVAAVLRAARRELSSNPCRFPGGTRGRCITCTREGKPRVCRRSHDPTRAMLRETLLLVRVLAATGARPGELCGARWADWTPRAGRDEAGHWWGVLRVKHKNQRHTGELRPIVVPPVLSRAIERMRRREGRHPEWIWTHRRGRGSGHRGSVQAGEPWTVPALGRRVRAWREKAVGAPEGWSLYWLRHGWYSTHAPRLGAEVAGLLGGTSAGVIRRVYLHGRTEELVRVASDSRRVPEKHLPPA